MIGTLIGFKKIEFEDDKGNAVRGLRIYVEYDDDSTVGLACDTKYFSDNTDVSLPKQWEINRKYEFVFRERGFSGKSVLTAVKPV